MLVSKTRKIEVLEIELPSDEIIIFKTAYNNTHTSYTFSYDQLTEEQVEKVILYTEGEHNMFLWIRPDGFETITKTIILKGKSRDMKTKQHVDQKLVDITLEAKDIMEIFKPVPLNSIEKKTLEYIPFYYGKPLYLQRDGFHLLVGPTGSGKTHIAIQNLPVLERNYDIVLYLSLEVTSIDIKVRYEKTNKKSPGDNLIIGQTISVQHISDYIGDLRACVIVDNVDNLVGAGDSAYDTQLKFVMEFDEWAKRTGNTGIFLTQITKDFKDNLVVTDRKTGYKTINQDITFNSVAGVKQLATMSRSIMLTHYDFNDMIGYSKILKKGSALFEMELSNDERSTFIK